MPMTTRSATRPTIALDALATFIWISGIGLLAANRSRFDGNTACGMPPGRKRIHVTQDGDHWKAAWEGAERASATGQTQAQVERRAKEIAANAGGGEVVIHDREGRIRDSDTVPPARDPNPPRDTRH